MVPPNLPIENHAANTVSVEEARVVERLTTKLKGGPAQTAPCLQINLVESIGIVPKNVGSGTVIPVSLLSSIILGW